MIDLINMKSSVRMMMMTGLKMFVKFPTDSETVYLHILRKNWQKIGRIFFGGNDDENRWWGIASSL